MIAGHSLTARGLKPVGELAQRRAHGDRLRYLGGCRCDLCRKANSTYERARQIARRAGDWNGIVPAAKARAHMAALQKQGIGRRTIADVTDIAETVLVGVRAGTHTNIRARTERLILGVTNDMAADHTHVQASPSWKLINELLRSGFTKVSLARRLGQKGSGLQLGKDFITVRSADRVRKMHAELIHSIKAPPVKIGGELTHTGMKTVTRLRNGATVTRHTLRG